MTHSALAVLLLLAAPAAPPPSPDKVIDVRAAQPPAGNTFEALWWAYKRAAARGDLAAEAAALREIVRLRVERNVVRLEPFALARVGQGLGHLREGQGDKAEAEFRAALELDPHLADAHFGLGLSASRRGLGGIAAVARHTVAGLTARLGSIGGAHQFRMLIVPALLLALLVTITVVSVALLLRCGRLLLHDLEEQLGPSRKAAARGVLALLLLLPVVALQGWGWLPLWWLALLFLYFDTAERVVAAAALLSTLAIAPLAHTLEDRLDTGRNPLFNAALAAVEGGPDPRAVGLLESAWHQHPRDRDLAYLVAALYKKGGRYDDAAALYNTLLQGNANDPYALNNLANLAFAAGEFQAAVPRYQQGVAADPPPEVGATLYYNMSLAHLQKFARQPANEARVMADRLAARLTREYEARWRYDFSNENAVVDLRLGDDQLWRKFDGLATGIAQENVLVSRTGLGALGTVLREVPSRFAGALVVFGLAILALSRWRGPRTFTTRCVKCGTPFCKHCHIGSPRSGLCTQCHHLFVVRDGVSGPARNQKLMEVQKEDARRERVFRVLSLVSPGAGHVYARRILVGTAFVFAWAALLSVALVAGLLLPFTDAPSMVARPWGWLVGGLVLVALYVAANRARPDFEVFIPVPRRGRAA